MKRIDEEDRETIDKIVAGWNSGELTAAEAVALLKQHNVLDDVLMTLVARQMDA